jgi:hypothetical protein
MIGGRNDLGYLFQELTTLARRLRTIAIVVGLVVIIGLAWLGASASGVTLKDLKTIAEVINNLVIAISIIVGAIWAYYKFIKERPLASRLEMDFSHKILHIREDYLIVCLEVISKNIGSTRIEPKSCEVQVRLLDITDNGRLERMLIWEANLVPPADADSIWYIEPNEMDFRTTIFSVGQADRALLIEAEFIYNYSHKTRRQYFIDLVDNAKEK